jgi:PPOX class probable F420-dependent enzyme
MHSGGDFQGRLRRLWAVCAFDTWAEMSSLRPMRSSPTMPSGPLPENVERFLDAPRPAVVGWLRNDGGPATAPVWYRYADGVVHLTMDAGGRRARQLRRDPRLSLSVLGDSWYSQVSLECRAQTFAEDTGFEAIDAVSRHYRGEPYPDHETPTLVVTATIERWHTFGEI